MSALRVLCFVWLVALGVSSAEPQWFRGNTHTHSLWSDGNDFPEMIMDWYKSNGYDFVALSDHNILAVDRERWMGLDAIEKRQRTVGRRAMEKYLHRFGEEWVETREIEGNVEVRLKTLGEYRSLFEEEGEFLILQAEEISNAAEGKPVHLNAVNLPGTEPIPAIKSGASVREIIRANVEAAAALESETGQSILVHLNHPNFRWGVTVEELAQAVEEDFFEVYNGHPAINHLGDADHPGDEKMWDIANAIRIRDLNDAPLFGLATDDSHNYHGGPVSPGRGWIVVRAGSLEGNALVDAMREGDFYASSGVSIEALRFDSVSREWKIDIQPQEGETFTTQFIGTHQDFRLGSEEQDAGMLLDEQQGTRISFNVPEEYLYVRATVISSRDHPNPSYEGQKKKAWLQPVGWRQKD